MPLHRNYFFLICLISPISPIILISPITLIGPISPISPLLLILYKNISPKKYPAKKIFCIFVTVILITTKICHTNKWHAWKCLMPYQA